MPDLASEKHIAAIPRFTLPPEFSNDKPAPAPVEATPPIAEAPKEEPKPPEAEAAPAPSDTPAEKPDEKEAQARPSQSQFERRITRAKQRESEALARAEKAEREAAELRAKSVPHDPDAPKMEEYTDIAEYGKAMREYGEKKALKDTEAKQKEERSRQFTQSLTSQWDAQAAKGEIEFDDWEETVGDLKPTAPWAIAIAKEENGYKIAHYLGKHTKEAQRIIAMDPYDQVREITKLAVKLQSPPAAPKAPSKAPAPINPVTTPAAVASDTVRPNQPFEEYMAIGNKMFRGRR